MATRPRIRLKLSPNFDALIARTGISKRQFASDSGVDYSTIKALANPEHHPHRKGGMHPHTAWKLARRYAELAKIDEDAAYQAIIVKEVLAANR
jgi:hypothetical protein